MRTVEELVLKKREAVRYRLAGLSLAETKATTGLSVPTITKAVEAFRSQGWKGVEGKDRGRRASIKLKADEHKQILLNCIQFVCGQKPSFCTLEDILAGYQARYRKISKKTLLRRLCESFPEQNHSDVFGCLEKQHNVLGKALVLGFFPTSGGCLYYVQDKRRERRFAWSEGALCESSLILQLDKLITSLSQGKCLTIVIKTDSLARYQTLQTWQEKHQKSCTLFAQWALTQALNQN